MDEKLAVRQVARSGSSPFRRGNQLPDVDTTAAVCCPEPGCGRRYLTEGHLAAHIEYHDADEAERELVNRRRRERYGKAAAQK